MKTWKREFDAVLSRQCHGTAIRVMYGASAIDVVDVTDAATGTPIPAYSLDEVACRIAASAAKAKGLIQAWSISEGPAGFAAVAVRYDGTAVRSLAVGLPEAWAWCLLDICQRRS